MYGNAGKSISNLAGIHWEMADSGRLTLFDLLTPGGPEAILCPTIAKTWYRPLRRHTLKSGEDLGLWLRVFLLFEPQKKYLSDFYYFLVFSSFRVKIKNTHFSLF